MFHSEKIYAMSTEKIRVLNCNILSSGKREAWANFCKKTVCTREDERCYPSGHEWKTNHLESLVEKVRGRSCGALLPLAGGWTLCGMIYVLFGWGRAGRRSLLRRSSCRLLNLLFQNPPYDLAYSNKYRNILSACCSVRAARSTVNDIVC